MRVNKLTPNQMLFFDEYLIDRNALQAAIRAGHEFIDIPNSFYTYFLVDPRNGEIFYVGKGKGKRMMQHSSRALRGKIDNVEKHRRITSIVCSGLKVCELVFSAYDNESDAYAVERMMILYLKDSGITNIVGGIVTNEELAYSKAVEMKSRIKTFNHWVATAPTDVLEYAERSFGSYRKYYDDLVNSLDSLIDKVAIHG